ncbi:hypothetical protein ACJX0J_029741, partial [Zea mays]
LARISNSTGMKARPKHKHDSWFELAGIVFFILVEHKHDSWFESWLELYFIIFGDKLNVEAFFRKAICSRVGWDYISLSLVSPTSYQSKLEAKSYLAILKKHDCYFLLITDKFD